MSDTSNAKDTPDAVKRFFYTVSNQQAIDSFLVIIDRVGASSDFEIKRNHYIGIILNEMRSAPDQWGEHCPNNIQWIGQSFINQLNAAKNTPDTISMDELFSICFRFFVEYDLTVPGKFTMDLSKLSEFALENISNFSTHSADQINYAFKLMPHHMLKQMMSSEVVDLVMNINKVRYDSEEQISDWEQRLTDSEKKVEILQARLEKQETAFNFMGLYDGFNRMTDEKTTEKNKLGTILLIMAAAVPLPLLGKAIWLAKNPPSEVILWTYLFMIPVISLTAILIYFFRIILIDYKSVKSQLIQLELRKTLCAFIQNYCDYSKEVKEKDKDALERFEQIIFSNIMAESEQIPAVFDGMEQLCKLVSKVKPQ